MKEFILGLCCVFAISPAWSQSREGGVQVSSGVGLALNSPVRFDLDLAGEFFFNDELSLGFNFDALVRKNAHFAMVPFARYRLNLLKAPRFTPYVGGGVGFQIGTNSSAVFDLMVPDLGFEYEVAPQWFVGPDVSFHLLAGDVGKDGVSWDMHLIARIAYRF